MLAVDLPITMGNKQPTEVQCSKPTAERNQNPPENREIHMHRQLWSLPSSPGCIFFTH